ncbi:S-adenosyl-L-methionine-dependent methyltransferase, partial [Endogone sp. FLAS-F59071]
LKLSFGNRFQGHESQSCLTVPSKHRRLIFINYISYRVHFSFSLLLFFFFWIFSPASHANMGNEISLSKDADSQSSPSSPSPYDDLRSNHDSADSTSSYTESNDNNSSNNNNGSSSPRMPRKFFLRKVSKTTRPAVQRKKSSNDESSTSSSTIGRKPSQSSNSQDEFSPRPNTPDDHFEASKAVPQFSLFNSPIRDSLEAGCKVLELGCDAGEWVIILARAFPNSHFLAVELSRSGITKLKNAPKNITFQTIDNFLRLPMDDSSFDFVQSKLNYSKILADQWLKVMEEIVRVTKPGGFVEMIEPDYPLYSHGPKTLKWAEAAWESMRQNGLHLSPGPNLECWLSKCPSLVFLSAKMSYNAIGLYSDGGLLYVYIMQQKVACMKMYDMKSEEFDKFASECLFECIDQKTSVAVYTVYAQKSCLV